MKKSSTAQSIFNNVDGVVSTTFWSIFCENLVHVTLTDRKPVFFVVVENLDELFQ